jgi:hypothetical protein
MDRIRNFFTEERLRAVVVGEYEENENEFGNDNNAAVSQRRQLKAYIELNKQFTVFSENAFNHLGGGVKAEFTVCKAKNDRIKECVRCQKYVEMGISSENHLDAVHKKKKYSGSGSQQQIAPAPYDTTNVNDQLEELRQKMREQETEIQRLQQRQTNNTTQINTVNNNNTQIINAFGSEDLSNITDAMMETFVRRTNKGLVELVEKIHYGNECNRNLRATTDFPELVEFNDGNEWQYGRRNMITNKLVDKTHEMMQEHFDDHNSSYKNKLSMSMFDYVNRWMKNMEKTNHALYADVMADVYVLILNKTRQEERRQ